MSAPIEEKEFPLGVNVVKIEDLYIARGKAKREKSKCPHLDMVYDESERRVWCKDCNSDVEAFDVLLNMVERYDRGAKEIDRRLAEAKEIQAKQVISRAAQQFDKVWRSRNMIPCCPNCNQGILPEDVLRHLASVSREYLEAQRKRKDK